jgi:phenylacetate-CoA ligase
MLEPLVRANFPRLQNLYDRFPSPARNVLTSARGWLLTQIRYSPATFEILRELRKHEAWTAEQIAAHQLAGIRKTLDHARRTVPFYKNYTSVEIRKMEDLRKLPVLKRETLRENQERFLSNSIHQSRRIRAGTTGTTGANLKVAYTQEFGRTNWAFLLRQWAWAGVALRQPRITFYGARVVPADRAQPPYWVHNLPERQILMSIFHLSEATAPAYVALLRRQGGRILEGFPSVLSIVADFALQSGEPIPMRAIFTSGEPLYPTIRAKLEDAFQAPVFDSYGMTEYCGLIHQCDRGQMHLVPEYGFLEILDENDDPVGPDEDGYFAWTGFLNEAMPLIRYRIGDRGRWQNDGPCACGRAFPLVVPTITRESDILRCPDGRLFSPRALNQLLKHSTSFRFCQFVHQRRERVAVRVVPGNNKQALVEMMAVRAQLQELLGSSVEVTAELAAEPLTRPGGKIPLIVNQVSQ